jgi:hypothetical protein
MAEGNEVSRSYEGPSDPFTCWCGAVGDYDDLCDPDGLEEACGGSGYLNCYCGGDLCVCHHHGGIECDGCEDCDLDEDDDPCDEDYP